jgi:hypothetical protein
LKLVPGRIGLEILAHVFTVGGSQETTFEHSDANSETVMSDGQFEITGAVLSVTTTLNVQVDLFPASSVAVYVTAVVPGLKLVPGGVGVETVAHPFTVGGVHVTTFEHSSAFNETLISEGQPAIAGPVLSVTTMLNEHVDILFAASFAVYVTTVVPGSKLCPGEKFEVSVTQLATVGGVHVTTFEHSAAVSETLIFAGQPEITGAEVSVTITLNEQVVTLFAASLAEYVTLVVPRLNVAPGEIFDVSVTQFSTVGCVHVTTREHSAAVRDTLMSAGQLEITGGVLSVTMTLNVHVDLFPAASVAV